MSLTFIFGGSFDPIHFGHLYLLEQIHTLFPEAKCLVIPCGQSPFKQKTLATAADRFKMLELATKQLPWVVLESYELEHSAPSYTYNTLQYLALQQPILIMGSDTFANFHLWYRAKELQNQVKFFVVTRDNNNLSVKLESKWLDSYLTDPTKLIDVLPGAVYLHHTTTPDISSSQIRDRCKANLPINHLVPEAVACYIYQHHLYK